MSRLLQTIRPGVGLCAAVLVTVGALTANAASPVGADLPTRELAPHFRGNGTTPPYTAAMLEVGMRMGAATADALRGDKKAAVESLAALRAQYTKVAAMVPSWRRLFPTAPLNKLAKATASGDTLGVAAAVDSLQQSCTNCHVQYMFPVQARYRWGTFADVSVPGKSDDVSFHQIMLDLANGLAAIRGDVAAKRVDAAAEQYNMVRDRFTMMEVACEHCHDESREYFIDSRVKGRLLRVGGMLRKGSVDVGSYNTLLTEINEMSCIPCHQVHMPAAFLQEYWKRRGK